MEAEVPLSGTTVGSKLSDACVEVTIIVYNEEGNKGFINRRWMRSNLLVMTNETLIKKFAEAIGIDYFFYHIFRTTFTMATKPNPKTSVMETFGDDPVVYYLHPRDAYVNVIVTSDMNQKKNAVVFERIFVTVSYPNFIEKLLEDLKKLNPGIGRIGSKNERIVLRSHTLPKSADLTSLASRHAYGNTLRLRYVFDIDKSLARVETFMNEVYKGCTSVEDIAKRQLELFKGEMPSEAINKEKFRKSCAEFGMMPEKFMRIQEMISVAFDAETESGQQARKSTLEQLREISSNEDPIVLEAREDLFKRFVKKRSEVEANSKALDISLHQYKCHNCDIQSKDLPEGQKLLRCGSCSKVFYCSKSCQVQHWKCGHKRDCRKQIVK